MARNAIGSGAEDLSASSLKEAQLSPKEVEDLRIGKEILDFGNKAMQGVATTQEQRNGFVVPKEVPQEFAALLDEMEGSSKAA